MKKQSNAFIVLALFLFFPVMAHVSSANAQDDVMEFVIAYYEDIENLNPLFWKDERAHWYVMCVYDSLLSYDENLEKIPWLAEAFNVSSDGLEVAFTLREGAFWHDGQPVTPEDVKFTFEHIRDFPGYINYRFVAQYISDVTVSGQDIVVTLDEVINWAADVLGNVPILPKHIREDVAADDAIWEDHTNSTAHIGSGMFKYVARIPGEYTLLERFDDWWGPDNPNLGQLPNIESLRIDVVRTQEARILAMINGDIDTERYEVYGPFVNAVLDAPELRLITGAPTIWCYSLGMNTTLPGLDDFEVRKAVAYVIDRQGLIDIGRQGFGIATTSVIPEAFYPILYHPDGDFPEQNITIGNQILDAAGWVDTDMNGIRDNGAGVELSFDLLVDSSDDINVATGTGLKLQLDEIGVDINVVSLVNAVWRDRIFIVPRIYEMFISGGFFRPYPMHPWLRMHSWMDFDGSPNPYGWVNNTFDDILDEFRNATPDELLAASRAVQIAATENMPYIPLYLSEDTHALRAEWENFSKKPGGAFSTQAPETMVFIYDSGGGIDPIILGGVGAGVLAVGVVSSFIILRRRELRTDTD